jgi:putative flippase GtrA
MSALLERSSVARASPTVTAIQRQILRFGVVGLLSTAIHAGLFLLLAAQTRFGPSLSNLIAYLAAWTVSYLGHYYFSFADPDGHQRERHAITISRYVQASMLTLASSAAMVHLVVNVLELSYVLCVPFLVTVVPAVAFCLNRYWVFRRGATSDDAR